LLFATPAHAQEPIADFYRGKMLRVIVGYDAGGGFDAYARLLAAHLRLQLPGQPTAIVQNMPGAASLKATNYIYSVGPQDGTLIGIPNHAVPLNAILLREVGDGLDVSKLNWIGRLDAIDAVMVAWHMTGVHSVVDIKTRELIVSATSPTGTSFMTPTALNRLIGTRFRIVQGYKGTADQYVAMERGEVEGMGNAIWSQLKRSHPHWLAGNRLVPLYQDNYVRSPDLPDVPTAVELVSNPDDVKVMRLLGSAATVGRSFFAGPQVPRERIDALRTAFLAMTRDKDFVAAAAEQNIVLSPMSGADLQAMIAELTTYPEALLERARALVKP
jgi:tripartite-type tricarboxylate transporter receptor subunit TctC